MLPFERCALTLPGMNVRLYQAADHKWLLFPDSIKTHCFDLYNGECYLQLKRLELLHSKPLRL